MFRKTFGLLKIRFVQVSIVAAYILLLLVFSIFRYTSEGFKYGSDLSSDIDSEPSEYVADSTQNTTQNIGLTTTVSENLTDILTSINQENRKQQIFNQHLFGPLKIDGIVVVIQVHEDRTKNLQHLIASLSKARGINNTLLVFSHSHYNDDINKIIRSITFSKVMQIFYPFSIQTHPNEFPATDPHDCPYDATMDEALALKCSNALHPDFFGHYRRAESAQLKHRWWWQLNTVFDRLLATKHHLGFFVFLQEDHYVAEDFIHMLRVMNDAKTVSCKHCNIFALGKQLNGSEDTSEVVISYNVSTLGLALTRSTWTVIHNHALEFCTNDDFNWDWSLRFISENYLMPRLYSMIPSMRRVFAVETCDVKNGVTCSAEDNVERIKTFLQYQRPYLYPKTAKLKTEIGETKQLLRNGGFNDPRDHSLCLNMTKDIPLHKIEAERI